MLRRCTQAPETRALKSKWSSFHQSHTDHIKCCPGELLTGCQAGSGKRYQMLFQDIRNQNQREKKRQRGMPKIRPWEEWRQIKPRMKFTGRKDEEGRGRGRKREREGNGKMHK